MDSFRLDPNPLVELGAAAGRLLTRYHRASLEGARHLPSSGPALLVGNHGLYGLESLVFFYLLWRHTGRFAFGLTDRRFFGARPIRKLLRQVGGIVGTPENAQAALRAGVLLVCYPGGAREVFKPPRERYRLAWGRSEGFVRVAIRTGAPVIPFAGLGVDDCFMNLGHLPLTRRVLGKYAVPVSVGLGPLPLPARLRFLIGQPLEPPTSLAHSATFKQQVQGQVESLLRGEDGAHPPRSAAAVS